MMNLPKISVITVSYNQGRFLGKTIRSVIKQNYPNYEYIIIDGGSTDKSLEIIRRYEADIKFWLSEKDNGQSHAFNKGLKHAVGEIVGWINSDDIYLGRAMFEASEYFQAHPKIDVVFSDYLFIDGKGRFLKRRKEIPFRYGVYLWTGDCYHANCAGFFRRSLFDRVGGLDEDLDYGMDYEFYMRAASTGSIFGHSRSYWAAYRLHNASKSVTEYHLMRKEARDIARRFQPDTMSAARLRTKRYIYKLFRFGWKLCIGSYPPFMGSGIERYG